MGMQIGAVAAIFGSSFLIAFSGAMMPGPLLTATIGESTARGPFTGPLLILGHGLLESALLVLLFLGLAPFLEKDAVFIIIAVAGALIMAWMAVGMFRSLATLSLDVDPKTVGGGLLVVKGILMSLANPYWTIWWVTIGLGYILHSREYGIWGVSAFFTGHLLADLTWYSVVSYTVSKGSRFFNDRAYRLIIGVCAGALVFFAGFFAYSGLSRLFV